MQLIRPDSFDLAQYLSAPAQPAKLRAPSGLQDKVVDLFYGQEEAKGALLPWPKTHSLLRFREAEMTLWVGPNGHGKTMITSQAALDLALQQGEKVCIASFEMQPRRTLWRMVRQAANSDSPSIGYIKGLLKALDGKLWLIDHVGTATPQLVLGSIRFAAKRHGIKHFFIDSLMKVVAGEDDLNSQKDFVTQLSAVMSELNVHIHLVHHIRKLENEAQIPGKYDVKGSGAIVDIADNLCICWRNKRKEAKLVANPNDAQARAEPDTLIVVEKQRNGEWEGSIKLWFKHASMSYTQDTYSTWSIALPPVDLSEGWDEHQAHAAAAE